MEIEDDFTNYLNLALKEMPEEFRKKLDNVNIFVEDLPTPEQMQKLGPGHNILLGLYEGIPQTKRVRYGFGAMPDKITLFRKSILYFARSKEHLIQLIKDTLFHEIGHHFGMSEEQIRRAQRKN